MDGCSLFLGERHMVRRIVLPHDKLLPHPTKAKVMGEKTPEEVKGALTGWH